MPGSVCFVAHLVLPLIHRTSDALVGGAEVQTFHLAEELHRRGWTVSFLACGLGPGGPEHIDTPLGRVHVLYPYRAHKTWRDKLHEKRRTFAAVQATTRRRVDLGLRLADPPLGGRLEAAASMGSGAVTARIRLASVEEVDDEVERWLGRAYEANT